MITAFIRGLNDQVLKDQCILKMMNDAFDMEALGAYLYVYQKTHEKMQQITLQPQQNLVQRQTLQLQQTQQPQHPIDIDIIKNDMADSFLANAQNNQTYNSNGKTKKCFNCKENCHFSADYPQPCKYCGKTDHRHYECQDPRALEARQKFKNNNNNDSVHPPSTSQQQSPQKSAMLLTTTEDQHASSSSAPPTKKLKVDEILRRTAIVNNPIDVKELLNATVFPLLFA
ncbi:unnamed protein product [Absidia cylindrospora]